jgi:hypothetical protein
MTTKFIRRPRRAILSLLLILSFLLAGQVALSPGASAATLASDNFNRANGALGTGWTATSDGALAISSQQVIGKAGQNTGNTRTGETYPGDQFSQIQVTSTALSGGQWIAAAVRMQSSGQNAYAGLYYWNFGSPELMLFKRTGGAWTQLGGVYNSGALATGTQLQVQAVGSTISLWQNGVQRLSVTDTSLTSGAPGIMAYGNSTADNWSGGSATTASTFTVGGTASGLSGSVVLQDNGGDNLSVSANGPFTFPTALASGSAYSVTVKTNPSGQTCTVTSGSGTIGAANVTNVAVSCANVVKYSVGGTASGLSGTVVLQDNGGDNLSVTASGPFTFATTLASGSAYSVTVLTNPTGQTCTVTSGSGTIAAANVTSVAVSCAASTGGTGTTASDDFNRSDGALGANWTAISDGAMSISGQQVIGTVGQNTGDIRTAETYPGDQYSQIQVTSTSLSGGQWIAAAVRMQNGGQDAYAGLYYWNFGSPELMLFEREGGGWNQLGAYNSGVLSAGTLLRITVTGSTVSFQQNGVQRLSVTNADITGGAPGIMAYGNSTADNWSGGSGAGGTTVSYSVGGTVSGLSGTLVLQDNGTDDLSLSASGAFTFATKVPQGAGYAVTVESSPASQNCTITNGSGTIGAANVTNVAIACANVTLTPGSDNFNRANGSLGAGWAATSDGAMAISSQVVIGTAGQNTGEIRTGETYSSDQYSQIEVTSTQLTGTQWIGAGARLQNSGQSGYVGLYTWNSGSPQLQLFVRNAGSWSQLGNSYNSGALPAGTQLRVVAVGNTIALLQNGVQRIAVSDSTFSGGAPGIMANGAATGDNWAAANSGFQVSTGSTSSGITSYNVISANNGYGPQTIRVLKPTSPAAGVAHNFLIVLPVETGLGSTFGDGLGTLQSASAQNQYNVTIIEPTFGIDSWYANNPNDPRLQYETFMTQELVPWIKQNLATTGSEQMWLIGFSKSGIGGQDLILKHPDLFTLAASWDFPADMATYDGLGDDPAAEYGTDANYQANYRLTQAFVDARKTPFLTNNRIWIGGYALYQGDMTDYNNLLNTEKIVHSTETPTSASHRWDSGWMPLAMAALYQDSLNQH